MKCVHLHSKIMTLDIFENIRLDFYTFYLSVISIYIEGKKEEKMVMIKCVLHIVRFFLIATAIPLVTTNGLQDSMEVFTLCDCDNLGSSYIPLLAKTIRSCKSHSVNEP